MILEPPPPAGSTEDRTVGARFAAVLDRRAGVVDLLLVLATIAVGFVVLGFLASYFQDYFRIILIFFFAWLLAFLISPIADFLQRRLRRLPRPIAVIAVVVPVICILAIVIARLVVELATTFTDFATTLPSLVIHPPPFLSDVQAWFDARGVQVDVIGTFQSIVGKALEGLVGFVASVFTGLAGSVGTFIDAIIVVSLAVFMAIDRDNLLRFGLDITPPERREEVLLFRRSIGSAFAGFIRSQLALGALYAAWALLVSILFGLPYGLATAALSGLIMAIPIYGPYVSWLPPVLVAILVRPEVAVVVAVAMLIGWFIDENILAPVVRAGALQLHPIVVTLAFLLGAELAGAIGALVAIPLAAVVQAFYAYYFDRYRAARGWSAEVTGSATGSAPPGAPPGTPPHTPSDSPTTPGAAAAAPGAADPPTG